MKMISIIIPFNNEKYLEKCLESVKKQKYKQFEVILIIDNSNIDENIIQKKYSKIIKVKCYKTSKETIGVGNARNLGVEKAKGQYIMFIDVDDTIDENLLMNLKQYINKGIELIKYKIKIKEKRGEEKLPIQADFKVTSGEEGFNKLCFKDIFLDSPCLYLIKKELFTKTGLKFEENVYHEDFGLIPKLIIKSNTIIATNCYGYNYFQSENSIMRNSDYSREIKKMDDKLKHYSKILEFIKGIKLKQETKINLLWYYTNSLILNLGKLKNRDREIYIKEIKKQKIIQNLTARTLKEKIKKEILQINIKIYLLILLCKTKNGNN